MIWRDVLRREREREGERGLEKMKGGEGGIKDPNGVSSSLFIAN